MKKPGAELSYNIIQTLFTFSASFIWSVNTLFMLKAGLSLVEVFVANAAFTAAMMLFELPTGLVADTAGRRRSFLLSLVFLILGTAAYTLSAILAWGFAGFVLSSLVLGLGFTFSSGALEAWVVDELKAEGSVKALDRVFARSGALTACGMVLGALLGGVLGQIDLAAPYFLRIAALFLLLIYAWFWMDEKAWHRPPGPKKTLKEQFVTLTRESLTLGLGSAPVRLILLSGAAASLFGIWGFYASQPYLLDFLQDRNAVWVSGLVTGGLALAQILGSLAAGRLVSVFKKRTSLLFISGLVAALFCLGLALSPNFGLALFCLLAMTAAQGLQTPVRQAYLNDLIPGDKRASLLSFDSLLSNGAAVGGQTGLAAVGQTWGLGNAYALGSLCLALGLPFWLRLRNLGQKEDLLKRGQAD